MKNNKNIQRTVEILKQMNIKIGLPGQTIDYGSRYNKEDIIKIESQLPKWNKNKS